MRAYCTQKDLPYIFKPVEGGHFSPENNIGKISLKRFSLLAINQKDSAQTTDNDNIYLAHLLQYHISLQPPEWFIMFLVTKHLRLTAEVHIIIYYCAL